MKKVERKLKLTANQIFGRLVSYGAHIIVVFVIGFLAYLSFVENLAFTPNWKTATLFSVSSVLASWLIWNMFYKRYYTSTIEQDKVNAQVKEYSVQFRYYMATKDWEDSALQAAIDKYNDEFVEKWLNWVEKTTGVPIESRKEVVIDPDTNEEKVVDVKGIKDLPYRKFPHKILMWRIKHHKYPKSGYKTSREVLSLFSSQDSDFKERKLHADKTFFGRKTAMKLLTSIFILAVGASITIQFIQGNWADATYRLILGLGALLLSIFFGAYNGITGARLKLAIVEDVCYDLEKWANTKPVVTPYKEPEPDEIKEPEKDEKKPVVTTDIFSKLNIQKE